MCDDDRLIQEIITVCKIHSPQTWEYNREKSRMEHEREMIRLRDEAFRWKVNALHSSDMTWEEATFAVYDLDERERKMKRREDALVEDKNTFEMEKGIYLSERFNSGFLLGFFLHAFIVYFRIFEAFTVYYRT
jgi:hypothetical protein